MRIRLRHTKLGKVRFLGHRDLARAIERALRRAEVPVAYTEGFSPRPRVHFGLALPMAAESVAEYVDVDVAGDEASVEVAELPARLSSALPEGVDVTAAAAVDRSSPSLQESVTSCTWELHLPDLDRSAADDAVATVLSAASLPLERERKGRTSTDDVRPYVLHLDVVEGIDGGSTIVAETATKPRGLRPAELLRVLGDPPPGRIRRTHQWISSSGARGEPLPLAATWTTHAPARAS